MSFMINAVAVTVLSLTIGFTLEAELPSSRKSAIPGPALFSSSAQRPSCREIDQRQPAFFILRSTEMHGHF